MVDYQIFTPDEYTNKIKAWRKQIVRWFYFLIVILKIPIKDLPNYADCQDSKIREYYELFRKNLPWDSDERLLNYDKKFKIKKQTWPQIRDNGELWKAENFGNGDAFLNEAHELQDYIPGWEYAVCILGFDTGMSRLFFCCHTHYLIIASCEYLEGNPLDDDGKRLKELKAEHKKQKEDQKRKNQALKDVTQDEKGTGNDEDKEEHQNQNNDHSVDG